MLGDNIVYNPSQLLNELKNKLNQIGKYNIKNVNLLHQAMTRQSAISQNMAQAYNNSYQKLEFLGDSILDTVICEIISENYLEPTSEKLTSLKIEIVNNKNLADIGKEYNLSKYLIFGKSEVKCNIRNNTKALADFIESIIGVIYIDSGYNYETTKNFIKNFLIPKLKITNEKKKLSDNI